MKTIMVVVVLAATVVFSAAAQAEEELKLNTEKVVWNSVALPAYMFTQFVFHEGVHTVTNEAFGFKTKSFEPYPHFKKGNFYFTYVEAWPKDGKQFVSREAAMRYWRDEVVVMLMMPYVVDVSLMATSGALLATGAVDPKSVGGLILYTAGLVIPWVDIFMNANVFPFFRRSNTDFGDTLNLVGPAPFIPMVVAAEAALISGGVAIVLLGREVFFDRVSKDASSKITVAPFAAKGTAGAGIAFRF